MPKSGPGGRLNIMNMEKKLSDHLKSIASEMVDEEVKHYAADVNAVFKALQGTGGAGALEFTAERAPSNHLMVESSGVRSSLGPHRFWVNATSNQMAAGMIKAYREKREAEVMEDLKREICLQAAQALRTPRAQEEKPQEEAEASPIERGFTPSGRRYWK